MNEVSNKTSRQAVAEQYTELYNQLGCFWAFNNEQFKEGRDEAINKGIIEPDSKYIACGHGLYCPSSFIELLIDGMKAIREAWQENREKAAPERVRLIFVGVDSWNRPVWKAPYQRGRAPFSSREGLPISNGIFDL